jgi:hypothetical protein
MAITPPTWELEAGRSQERVRKEFILPNEVLHPFGKWNRVRATWGD